MVFNAKHPLKQHFKGLRSRSLLRSLLIGLIFMARPERFARVRETTPFLLSEFIQKSGRVSYGLRAKHNNKLKGLFCNV